MALPVPMVRRTSTIEEHTHHKAASPGSNAWPAICLRSKLKAFRAHSSTAHTFRFISPEMTDKYGIPNPCTSCHKEKSTVWAKDEIRGWPGYSPWQLAP